MVIGTACLSPSGGGRAGCPKTRINVSIDLMPVCCKIYVPPCPFGDRPRSRSLLGVASALISEVITAYDNQSVH